MNIVVNIPAVWSHQFHPQLLKADIESTGADNYKCTLVVLFQDLTIDRVAVLFQELIQAPNSVQQLRLTFDANNQLSILLKYSVSAYVTPVLTPEVQA